MHNILSANPDTFILDYPDFVTNAEIRELINIGETHGNYEQAGVRQPDGSYKMLENYRKNSRGSYESEAITTEWFDKAKQFMPSILRFKTITRLHPVLRFYKYGYGDYFNPHKDASLKEGDEGSLLTFMIYLTSVGDTRFELDTGAINVAAVAGKLVIFNHKIVHSSPAITSNDLKIVVRSDVMYRLAEPI